MALAGLNLATDQAGGTPAAILPLEYSLELQTLKEDWEPPAR